MLDPNHPHLFTFSSPLYALPPLVFVLGGSSKDRVALAIVSDAERKGLIRPYSGCTIFEGTVGSTGISLALIARAKGYNCHIVMPGKKKIK